MERTDICKLCFEDFGDQRRPRGLHCGHSYCTDCLDKLFDNGNLSCPKCKRNHRVSNARDFSINYDFEESLLEARKAKACKAPASHSSTKFNKIQTMIAEQKTIINNLMVTAEDMRLQLKGYKEFLLNRKSKHDAVLQKIRELGSLHETLMEEINVEHKRIMDVQKEGDKYCKEMKDLIQNLDNPVANIDSNEIFECFGELEDWIDQCQQEFPSPKITAAEQILTTSLDGLPLVDSKTHREIPVLPSGHSNNENLNIMEKLTQIDGMTLSLAKLRVKPEYWRKRIAGGQVYAVDSSNGRKRSAVLSERDGKIYLHYLQDREAPVLAYTIEHSAIVNSLNNDATVVFMDLAWDDSTKGRIHICLSPDTLLGRHFRILCTGDFGPTYAHSKFLKYYNYPVMGCIVGGDYEYNDGRGGSPVIEELDRKDDIYCRRLEEGAIFVPMDVKESQIAQFAIIIHCCSGKSGAVFGKVQNGIEVLREAARYRDVKEVEIINCGVQLPL